MKVLFRTSFTVLVLLSLFSLISCSGNQENTANNPNNKTTDSNNNTEITLALNVANIQNDEPATYAIVQEFMKKYPNISIKLEGSEQDNHLKTMKLLAQTNDLPEIFWMSTNASKKLAEIGKILDLKELTEKTGIASRMGENMLAVYQHDGLQYGLPYQVLVTGLWYNKAIFDQYNLELPTTFNELKEVVKTFKENNVVTIAQGTKTPHSVWAYMSMLTRYGFFDKVDKILAKEVSWNNPDFLKYYQKIQELGELGAFPDNMTTMDYNQASQMFLNGKSAMLNSGVWETKNIAESGIAESADFWWGPTFNDGVGNQNLSTIVPSSPLVVSAEVKKDAAKYDAVQKFIDFFYSDEGAEIMVDTQKLPLIKYDGEIDTEKYPIFAKVIHQMNKPGWVSAKLQPNSVLPDNVISAMYDSILGVASGIYNPEQAADTVDAAVKK